MDRAAARSGERASATREIDTIAKLHEALQAAVALEFATIPPYLSAWWTIRDRTCEVALMLQEVAISEMRHLAVVANILIATGGTPDFWSAVPRYPARIGHGNEELRLSLLPFGEKFLDQALALERPDEEVPEDVLPPSDREDFLGMGDRYWTIGQFYRSVVTGLEKLVHELGEPAVFCEGGRTRRQLAYFGAQRIRVASLEATVKLLRDVIWEGEGEDKGPWTQRGELAHYYVFDQIKRRQRYCAGDSANNPSGPPLEVPDGTDHVVPMLGDARQDMYLPETSTLWQASASFNDLFAGMTAGLDAGFKGDLWSAHAAVGQMLQLPESVACLFAHPVPAFPGSVGGPTFELPCPCPALPGSTRARTR